MSPRTLRTITLAYLALVLVVAAVLIGWAIYDHATFDVRGYTGREGRIAHVLWLTSQHPKFVPAAVIGVAAIAAGGALLVLMWRNKRWAFLATAIGAALAIAPTWLIRHEMWRLERATASAKWADRSPYVKLATFAATGVTIALALLVGCALATWFAMRPRRA